MVRYAEWIVEIDYLFLAFITNFAKFRIHRCMIRTYGYAIRILTQTKFSGSEFPVRCYSEDRLMQTENYAALTLLYAPHRRYPYNGSIPKSPSSPSLFQVRSFICLVISKRYIARVPNFTAAFTFARAWWSCRWTPSRVFPHSQYLCTWHWLAHTMSKRLFFSTRVIFGTLFL